MATTKSLDADSCYQIRAVTEDDTGIEVLYQPSNPNIDIVAIHGLGAHPDDTWCKNIGTPESPQWVNWLKEPDMLPSTASNVRIMRYGYESAWFGSDAIKQSTTDAAEEFLDDLKGLREAMIHARLHSKRWPDLLSFTTGLIFFGTPFRGAEGISQSELLQAAIEEHKVVEAQALRILDPGNDPLEDLVTDFCRLHSVPHKAQIACFFEQKPSNIMAIVGKNAQKSFVVSRSSGCLDESESTQKYRLARTHFDMNKFGKPSERGFTKVAQVVKGMVEAAPNLLLSRLEVDEPNSIAAVRRLVEVTDSSLEEACQEHAERIQEDMTILIEMAFQKANFTKSTAMNKVHGPQSSSHRDADLRRILAIVRIDTTVKINRRIQHRSITSNVTRLVAQTYKDTISIANGRFDIRTTKCKTETDQDASFASVVTFTADESQYKQFSLSMHFFQRYGNDGSNVLPPCIIAHAVIPDDSPTIQAVRNGNLTEFKRLLENGKARVWDCDSEGRSLLKFAIHYLEPAMVEYLIAQGLDVNSVEKSLGGSRSRMFDIT
ncbi:hypothetical protein D6C91_08531 [Aureobasidium pullulans]|uniref:Uncharacterized protein n=1 Tax=Aureobasidium pullulans TaxID=5580 RepID=A0A4V4KHV3_AURPU|nr:hypothetical protein D6C91_08531 [Aureobasidium pullulans]